MTKYLLIILCVLTASCSSTKRMKKLIDKEPKEAALYISQAHPELLEPRTVTIDTIIRDTITVTVPEYSFDTVFVSDSCKEFHYIDNRIKLDIKDGKVSYRVLQFTIKEVPVEVPVYIEKDCPPAPTKVLLDFANKKLKKAEVELELKKKDVDYWRVRFFILVGIILIGLVFKFRKFLGVPF